MSIDRAKAQKAAQKYLAKGQIDRAITEFENVVKADPSDARSLLKLGDLYTRRGDAKGAVATYRKVAGQYAAEGFFLKAVAVYKQILKLDGSDLGAHESLAEAYEKLSLLSDAVATYEHVADAYSNQGKNDRAVKALGRLAELDKENVAAWVRYAEALSKADRIDEACDAFRRGAGLLKQAGRMDDYIKVTERLLFHSHEDLDRARDLAGLYLERAQPKAALLHLQTCFKADARHPATLGLLARSFLALGQAQKAVSVYRELARVYGDAGDAGAEAEVLRELLTQAPDDADARRRLSELSAVGGGGGEAIELIEGDELDEVMVVEEDDDADADTSGAYPLSSDMERETQIARLMAECEVFLRYGLRDKVVPQLKRVLAIDPRHTDAREKLTQTYRKRGEDAEAIAQLLVLAEQATDPPRARAYLEEAAELDPVHPQVIARLQRTVTSAGAAPVPSSEGDEIDEDDVIFVDEDEEAAAPRPASLRPAPLDESDFSDLRSAPPRQMALPASPAVPPGVQALASSPAADEETLQVVGISSLPPAPPLEAQGLGPREMSLASALEGPADEALDSGVDDDEPELLLEADDELEQVEELEQAEEVDDAQHVDAAEDVPAAGSDAIEEADFYLSQQLFDEAREVLIEAMYEHPSDPMLKRKLAEVDELEAGGGAARVSASEAPTTTVRRPSSFPAGAPEDRSFALAEKLADRGAAGAGGPVDVGDVIHQFKEGVRRQVDKSDTATHYDLGIAYMEMGLHAEAIDEFQLCLEGGDRKHTAHTMIGLSYVAKGDMEPAIEHFHHALSAGGQSADEQLTLWFEVGNACELLGKASEALVWYEKVEEVNPTFRDVAQRIERLGVKKTAEQETDEFDAMFDNMIAKE